MSRVQRHLFALIVAGTMLCACSFSPNVPNGHLICQSPSECPSGYTCESVAGAEVAFRVCCKDKGCGSKVLSPAGADGSADLMTETGPSLDGSLTDRNPTTQDDASSAPDSKTSDLVGPESISQGDAMVPKDTPPDPDGLASDLLIRLDAMDAQIPADAPEDAVVLPDLSPPDLKTPDAQGTCGNDQDCPTTAPMCFKGTCAPCTIASDCTGHPLGGMCDTKTGRCASCLGNTDCKDATKPLCGQGNCTSCTYATTPNGCCSDSDCMTGASFTVGKCNTTAHSCSYTCDPNHKSCAAGGPCIPSASCCGDGDCTATLSNECQYQGCLADTTTCGPKNKPNTSSCSSGAGMCDGAGTCVVCSTGQYKCAGSVLEVCNSTHTGFTQVADCGGANLCNPSGPTCYSCSAGDYKCTGSLLQKCNTTRTGFDQVADCGGTNLCNPGGPVCYKCVPNQAFCDPNDPHTARTCSSDGQTSTPTTDVNKWCVNGQLVQCRGVSDCPAPTNPCVQSTCNANTCGTSNKGASVACAGNGICDGGSRCIGPVGNSCRNTPVLNCQGVDATGAPQTVSCCQSMLVGGTFPMGRGASDDCPTSMSCGTLDQPEHTATVTGYYLDAFEVTVGRFRKFYLQYGGPFVSPGAGAHAGIANSGWDSSWNNSSYLPDNSTTLLTNIINCTNSSWPSATDPNPPDPEQRPVNCVTWYEAFAFCVYDGGRLPTEAEWELAAAGGSANLFYPWGNYSTATLPANYSVNLHSAKVSVGSAPGGVGLFGQLDLIGSVNEWILDGIGTAWYSPGSNGNPCTDCADLLSSDVTFRGLRGGAWSSSNLATLRAAARKSDDPATLSANYGIRCAHDKTQ